MWHDPAKEVSYSEYLELDLSTVVPSISGPKRPQDRIELSRSKEQFREDLVNYVAQDENVEVDANVVESFPASDAPSHDAAEEQDPEHEPREASAAQLRDRAEKTVPVTMPCLLYTSPSPRDVEESRMPSSA